MPAYKEHNIQNARIGSVLFLIISFYLPWAFWIISGFIFATFLCGNDLDIKGDMMNNWGLLKFYWLPYSKLFPHGKGKTENRIIDGVDVKRGPSHWILIGTVTRLLWLTPLVTGIFSFNSLVQFKIVKVNYLISLYKIYFFNQEFLMFFGGMVAADLLHILLDKQK